MAKSELTPEERFLKDGDRSANYISVDVHDPVMKALGLGGTLPADEEQTTVQTLPPNGGAPNIMRRVETEAGTGRKRKRILRIRVQGWVAALLVVVLLGGGYTQYSGEVRQGAGAQYKVLPYKPLPVTASGGMIEKAKEPLMPYTPQAQPGIEDEAYQESKLYSQKYSKGHELMKELLLPGEYATYVIAREDRQEEGSLNMYLPPLTFKEYAAYKTSVEKHNIPLVKQPAYMPEGYVLDEAIIKPSFLKVPDEKQLEGGNERDLGDNFRLIWRVEKAENLVYQYSSLIYKKGETQVRIGVSRVDDNSGPAYPLPWSEKTKVENVEIGGKQLIYLDDSSNTELDLGYKYKLVWSDPEAQIIYSVAVGQENSELTKDDIILIAASMIN
ncbi:hypothetical protein [Paenibacillus sp. FSL R5-0912]|uniref:hypothetical protein n=1 Tax=Paenibacillus sp. FSL R5-0912 TaxID=1536771 RepID=UPI0004F6A782|nr:hypothetical protein [Paenibacillus sp. FSL R5-0912]AIQ39986.1 hypothetical protein R50912_08045 [Paenibacillus sp. FSL R5-0912]